MNETKEVVVTLKGMKGMVRSYAKDVIPIVEVDPARPIFTQLMHIDPECELVVVLSDRISKQHGESFKHKVFQANAARKVFMNTHQRFQLQWSMNALSNYERIKKARLVTDLKKKSGCTQALIVGNGPSADTLSEKPSATQIFACWHVTPSLLERGIQPDYVVHADVNAPFGDFHAGELPPETAIIATPTAAPRFVSYADNHPLYVYLSQEVPIHSWFAQHYGCSEHEAITGTVITGAIHSAIYAGYQNINLIGVDLGYCTMPHWANGSVQETKNQFGASVYTTHLFSVYLESLEDLVTRHPQVQFLNSSTLGLDIRGVKPVSH